jgi:hypothetical protein
MLAERVFLAAIALGLLLIGQPWSHALFVVGFPLTFLGLVAFNVASWFAPPVAAGRAPAGQGPAGQGPGPGGKA